MRAPIITEIMQGDGLAEWETQEISVKDPPFGAKGDGVTDDTAAINLALDSTTAYGSTTRRIVHFPAGTYLISGTLYLRKGDVLVGSGYTNTRIHTDSAIAMLKMGHGLIGGFETVDTGGLVPFVKGIWFSGSIAGATGIDATRIAGYSIQDCWFMAAIGMHLGGSDGIISNCEGDYGLGSGVFMKIGEDGQDVHTIRVVNCGSYGGDHGIQLEDCYDILISNFHVDYAEFFSVFVDTGSTVTNIRFSNCHFITSINSDYYDDTQKHIYIKGSADDMNFIGCTFDRSRLNDVLNSTEASGIIRFLGCTFKRCNDESVKNTMTGSLIFLDCIWDTIESYAIASNYPIYTSHCIFDDIFGGGLPADIYDKGAIKLDGAGVTDSFIAHNKVLDDAYAIVCFKTNAVGVSVGNISGYTYDSITSSANVRSEQERCYIYGTFNLVKLPGIETLLGSGTVNLQNGDPKTTVYTVPAGRTAIITKVVIHDPSGSLAGGNDFDIGSGANADTWLQANDLSAMIATTDYKVITSTAKYTLEAAAAEFGIKPITGAAANVTAKMDVFGYLNT